METSTFRTQEIVGILEEILNDANDKLSPNLLNSEELNHIRLRYSKEELLVLAGSLYHFYPVLCTYVEKVVNIKGRGNFRSSDKIASFSEQKKEWISMQEEKPSQDLELEDMNNYRKLPMKLSDEEKKFYNISEYVRHEEIERIYHSFMSNMNTFSPEDSDDMEKLNNSNVNESLETYNEEEDEKISQTTDEPNFIKRSRITRSTSNLSTKKSSPQMDEKQQQNYEKETAFLKNLDLFPEKDEPEQNEDLPFPPLLLKK